MPAWRCRLPSVNAAGARAQQLELLVHPLGIGLAPNHETPPPTPPNVVGKAEEAEGPFSVLPGNGFSQALATEAQQRGL